MTSGYRPVEHKPAELFRADLISAMKLPDSTQMESGAFVTIKEPWRTEWEVGVQVCVNPEQAHSPNARVIDDPPARTAFTMPDGWLTETARDSPQHVKYDLDDLDLNWLETVNQKRKFRALAGPEGLTEETFRKAIIVLETKCQQGMAHAITTEESLGMEYDEHTVCDVCRDQDAEDSNDIIFCDSCNLCVHQACYGVISVPKGEWLCKVCSAGETTAACVLCTNHGGALKRVRPGNSSWSHLSCALWIPEVRVGNPEKMEPISNIESIPPSRWSLVCCVCRAKKGACIQCAVSCSMSYTCRKYMVFVFLQHPSCVTAFHVTCAFKHGLVMTSRLDMISKGVIHESYCPKHSVLHKSPTRAQGSSRGAELAGHYSQLVQLQEAFHNYASPDDLSANLKLSTKLSTLIYNFWKLKRKSQYSKPLLSHLPIETSLESIKAELAAGARFGLDADENFRRIVHMRQNLEKVRNLVYMVLKREKLKKQLLRNQSELCGQNHTVFEHEQKNIQPNSLLQEWGEETPSPRHTRSMTQRLQLSPLPSPPMPGSPSSSSLNSYSTPPAIPSATAPPAAASLPTIPPVSTLPAYNTSTVMTTACNHILEQTLSKTNNLVKMNGPKCIRVANAVSLTRTMCHFNKECFSQKVALSTSADENHLVRRKMRQRFSDSDIVVNHSVDHNGTVPTSPNGRISASKAKLDGLVYKTGIASNLRPRPYSTKSSSVGES